MKQWYNGIDADEGVNMGPRSHTRVISICPLHYAHITIIGCTETWRKQV
jgi:hypothetical protein